MPHRNTLFSLVLLALPACVDEADDTTPDPASTTHPSSGAGPDAPSTAASTDELEIGRAHV
mgnify:CR=1 FL=1